MAKREASTVLLTSSFKQLGAVGILHPFMSDQKRKRHWVVSEPARQRRQARGSRIQWAFSHIWHRQLTVTWRVVVVTAQTNQFRNDDWVVSQELNVTLCTSLPLKPKWGKMRRCLDISFHPLVKRVESSVHDCAHPESLQISCRRQLLQKSWRWLTMFDSAIWLSRATTLMSKVALRSGSSIHGKARRAKAD